MTMPELLQGYLEKSEFAQQFHKISTRTLDRWERQGIGPPRIKVGKKIFYRIDGVRDWLASHEQGHRRTRGAR